MALSLPANAGPFIAYRGDRMSLRSWAAANPGACLRRFEVVPIADVTPAEITLPDAETVRETFEVVVAYPRDNRFGSRRALEAVIAADLQAIDYYIGTTAHPQPTAANVISGPHRRERRDGVIFGVLPLMVVYARSAA